jgi:uncharacterized protein with PIN domain
MWGRRGKESSGPVRFLLDGTLGSLARRLRMLGFDAEYCSGSAEQLASMASNEERWFLTRRASRLPGRLAERVLRIREDGVEAQVVQVIQELRPPLDPALWFSRCIRCNQVLQDLPWEEAREWVPDFVARTHRHFRRCPECRRVFWPGTHTVRMRAAMKRWARRCGGKVEDGPDHGPFPTQDPPIR